MFKITIKTILLIAGFAACGIAAAGGGGIPSLQPPVIVKAVVDAQEKILIITGRNFGATLPTVMLADQALGVKRFSEQEVVASLPPSLTPGNYGVFVTTSGRNRVSSNLYSTSLQTPVEAMR